MTKIEQVEFENVDKFNNAIKLILEKGESFRTFKDSEGIEKKTRLIGNNNLYLGNGFTLNINKSEVGKVYVSIGYYSAEDRINIAVKKRQNNNV
jgi:hypothetical protein